MAASRRVVPLARWSVVVAIVLMGVALLVTAWTTNRGVRDASDTLVRGQANGYQQAVRAQLAELGGAPADADLALFLEEHQQTGLRYVGLFDPERGWIAQTGTPSGDGQAVARVPPEVPVRVGGRVRMSFRTAARRAERGGPPGERGRRGWMTVIEFEPREATQLRAAATRTLGIGALGASTLLVVAAVLVRWVVRREATAREAERARRLASLGELSAVLAHEIRNPLASLKGNAQLLAGALPEGEKSRAKAERVVEEAIRLEQLTNDLLDFVRTGELRRADADPAALLRESAALAAPGAELDTAGAPASWSLDGERLRQVLTNLLENAAQAGGPVRARVASGDGGLVFEVRDGGAGIAAEDLEHVFEPFFTRRTRGTGLGLAVAKRVVELHRGTITAANAEGGGALFRVVLPRG